MKQYIGKNNKVWGKYDEVTRTLLKDGLDREHLLYKFGGVPAWDKTMYDSIKPAKLWFKTNDKVVAEIPYEKFEAYKQEIDYKYGKQYVTPIEYWDIKS